MDTCAKGQTDYFVCLSLDNNTAAATFKLDSQWYSCGSSSPPPVLVAAQKRADWSVNCGINFWGEFHYRISIPGNGQLGTIDETYSTFTATANCDVIIPGAQKYDCTSGYVMTPTNANASGEGWHYQLNVSVAPTSKEGGTPRVVHRSLR